MNPNPSYIVAQAFCELYPEFSISEKADPSSWAQSIIREDGASLLLLAVHSKVECKGIYPKDCDGHHTTVGQWLVLKGQDYKDTGPRASASASRDPKAIVKDFAKRVLVPYLPLYEQCAVQKAEQKAEFDAREARVKDILSLMGPRDQDYTMKGGQCNQPLYSFPAEGVYGDLYVASAVDLALRGLSDDQTKRILLIAMER
jgi:hypothetical protein